MGEPTVVDEPTPSVAGTPRVAGTGYRCGYVALVGRPNVGKSTLLNRLVGQKVSIVSRRPQTTRHRILGIRTGVGAQLLFVDTPGLQRRAPRAINRMMNRVVEGVLGEVDVVAFVVEAPHWRADDQLVVERLAGAKAPVVLVVNKIDRITPPTALLPYLAEVGGRREFAGVVPVSGQRGINLDRLTAELVRHLPEGAPLFPADQPTDRTERFLAGEIVREKLVERLGEELPHRLTVEIASYREEPGLTRIEAVVWVERPGQKAIVIGQGGRMLKAVGTAARRELERMMDTRVYLQLWAKVAEGWSDDERSLRRLGYPD
jgi:GTP-binding protein Era